MPYMLAPGARLEVGPGGKMYESMGCDRGCFGLGAVDKSGNVIGGAVNPLKTRATALDPRLAAALPGQSFSGKFFSGSTGTAIALSGVAAAAAIFFLTRKKRRRR